MGSNVWLTFLAELWVAGVMGYMALSLGRGARGVSGGGDAAFVDVTLALAAVAAVALVVHASALVAGMPV